VHVQAFVHACGNVDELILSISRRIICVWWCLIWKRWGPRACARACIRAY